jgi:hypothetical protein
MRIPHVIEVEEDIFPILISYQEAIIVIFEEELQGPGHLHQLWIYCLHGLL